MICASCQTHNPAGNRFCGACGAALGSAGLISRNPATALEREGGERRRVVLMFSDIVSSTEIATRLDPEDWRELLVDYHSAATTAVTSMGGFVAQYLGDGLLAYFGWPIARENDAERAVLAGHAILDAVAEINRGRAQRRLAELGIRIGIHAGEVVVSRSGYVYGEAINVAARIQAIADVNTVTVSEPVFASVGRRIATEDLGGHSLRGLDGSMHLYRVLSPKRPQRSPRGVPEPSRFVGRHLELQTILERWDIARLGKGQSVVVSGEAGIGKSRLLREFQSRIQGAPHVWLESAGSEIFRSTPLYPVLRLLDRFFRAHVSDHEGRRRRLRELLAVAGLDDEESMLAINALLGVSARPPDAGGLLVANRRARQLRTLVSLALQNVRRRPGVLVLEDMHWTDPSTIEFIEALIDSAAETPTLIILTTRPEFRPPWRTPPHQTDITLGRLSRGEICELVRSTVGGSSLGDDVVDWIVDRTSGIPLFAEELARLVKTRSGTVAGKEIPATLGALLNARLDQVGSARDLAQIAAVIGDEISPQLLSIVAERDATDVAECLERLVGSNILAIQQGPTGRVFGFTHTLLRDAVYETLLRSQRRDLHERVANAIVAAFPTRAEAQPEIVATHLAAAGRHDRAAEVWHQASVVAISRSAYREAEAACHEAVSNLLGVPESPERTALHAKLQSALVGVLQVTQGYSAPKTAEAAGRARELAEQGGDVDQRMMETVGRFGALSSAGRYVSAYQVAEQFFELACREGHPASLASAQMMRMTSRYRLGDLVGAEQCFEDGRSLFAAEGFTRRLGWVAQTFGNASRNAWMLGHPDEARRRMAYALAAATASNSAYDIAFSRHMAAVLAVLMRDARKALDLAEQSIDLADANGFPQFAAISRVALGRALVHETPSIKALDLMNAGIAGMAETGSRVAMTMYLAWLAEAQAAIVSPVGALEAIERAMTFNPEERFFQPELLRIRGELRAATGDVDGAEADILAAVSTAAEMEALGWQLRAALSLDRLRRRVNFSGARDVVTALYERFTEGHDTADLVEAAAVARRADRV